MGLRAKTNFWRNLALMAASLTAALALCEGITRLYLKSKHEETGAPLVAKRERLLGKHGGGAAGSPAVEQHGQYEELLELHPFFGFVHRQGPYIYNLNPRGPRHANRWGFQTPYDISLCGDRYCVDNEPDRRKMLVIGLFGGSFAHYMGDFGDYLEDELEEDFPGRRVIVINFAQGGHAFPQALNIYSYFRDVVDLPIFLDGLNELWNPVDNNRAGFPPEYAKAPHYKTLTERAAHRSPARQLAENRILALKSRIRVATELSLTFGVRNSALVFVSWNALTDFWANRIQDEVARIEKSFDREGRFFDAPDQQVLSFAARQWGEYHRLVAGIARLQGVPSIHLLQPNPWVRGSKALSTEERRLVASTLPELAWYASRGYPKLRATIARFKEPGAVAEDLTEFFKSTREDVWRDGAHTNPKGTHLVLDHLAALVRKAFHKR